MDIRDIRMDTLDVKNKYVRFYEPNSDWKGTRSLDNDLEIVEYQNDSTIRIWYNEQTEGFSPHWHTALEIIMPVENYYDVTSNGTDYHIMPGEILVIPPGELHQLFAPSSGKRFIFLFDITYITKLKGFSSVQSLLSSPLYITKARFAMIYDDIYRLLLQMRNEYFSSNDFRELSIYSHLLNFFVLFAREHLVAADIFPNVRTYKQKEYMKKFEQVLDYIDTHYMEELTLDAIADYSGFSRYHFTRLFKQYTQTTFYDYLSFKRIKVVEELLAEPDLSITEIALQAGFSSISTFNRIFKQHKQCTPSQYRAQYRRMC